MVRGVGAGALRFCVDTTNGSQCAQRRRLAAAAAALPVPSRLVELSPPTHTHTHTFTKDPRVGSRLIVPAVDHPIYLSPSRVPPLGCMPLPALWPNLPPLGTQYKKRNGLQDSTTAAAV